MNFLNEKYKQTKKTIAHMWNPNENPTEQQKHAFQLLDRAEAEDFIEFVENTPSINMNVVDFNKVSFLMMATSIANKPNNIHKRTFTDEELLNKAIIATNFVLSKKVNIDYRDKNGATALLTACHWGNYEIAELLLKNGANPHISSYSKHFATNPLLSAYYKKRMNLVILLFKYGARVEDVEKTVELSKKGYGFPLNDDDINFLRSLGNIATVIRKKREDESKKKNTVLTGMSENLFEDICYNI